MRKSLAVDRCDLLGLSWIGMAAAQNYPAHPITMIVPFPAGGATDTLARFLAENMRPILGPARHHRERRRRRRQYRRRPRGALAPPTATR